MMKYYTTTEKVVWYIYMFIPFIFELRTFIDWTYTTSSLDVFQWIKLAQIQAVLYKAKATNRYYFEKPVG
jgi:piezo-type mechanosensitive ion channel component 1/2